MTDPQRNPQSTEFNLVNEPWIPVITLDGSEREVSLREALISAHEFRDITGELPTTRFALLRILLSVAYRVLDQKLVRDPIRAWEDLWVKDVLPAAEFDGYFDRWHHRFDLLDPAAPFMQSPDLRTAKDEWKPVSLIVADSDPDGALFTMRSELDTLTFAEAARWLVHAHAYDYSGIKSGAVGDARVKGGKGYPMGIGWAGWLGGAAFSGGNLRETILLNLIVGRTAGNPGDLPAWEQAVTSSVERTPAEIGAIGPISLMSWQQRRIRLRAQEGRVAGVLVSNGDPLDYTIRNRDEPMTGWRYSDPQSAKAKALRYMPRKLEPGRALWRGLSTLIPTPTSAPVSDNAKKRWGVSRAAEPAEIISWVGDLVDDEVIDPGMLIELSVVSMEYGTQNASYAEVLSDRLAFSVSLAAVKKSTELLSVTQSASTRAEAAVHTLQRLAADLERAAGGSGDGTSARVAGEMFARFDQGFREWLLDVVPGCDSDRLLQKWTEIVRSAVRDRAKSLAEDAPTSAWIGRPSAMGGQIVSVATAMRWFENGLVRELGLPPARPNLDTQEEPQLNGDVVGAEAAE